MLKNPWCLPGPWVIPEEEPYIPFLRLDNRRAVEARELPAGFLSGRLSGNRALRAVREFYRERADELEALLEQLDYLGGVLLGDPALTWSLHHSP